jgi:cytochrome c-type biogenesis protein CcmH
MMPRIDLRPIMRFTGLFLLLAASLAFFSPATFAAGQVDVFEFPSPEMEARYRLLIDEFRCPKCLNTNLSGSDAPIAKDLRKTVWRLLVQEGMSDQEVRDFLQARYGDFVLYNPPFKPGTWILWLAPLCFGLIGIVVLIRMLRARPETNLSEADSHRADEILRAIEEQAGEERGT